MMRKGPVLINEEKKVERNSVLDFVYFLYRFESTVCIYRKNEGWSSLTFNNIYEWWIFSNFKEKKENGRILFFLNCYYHSLTI